MRALIQRVERAAVRVIDESSAAMTVGEIGPGLCVFVGVTHDDDESAAGRLADKIWNLRVFDDDEGVMNRALSDGCGDVLVVSQFTLYGDTSKGRRPSWIAAARPDVAEPLVDAVVEALRALGANVETGRFRTEMHVELVNDGPVTLSIET
jgi:D-aminoacyl-tRNA deacylase